ncbi:hypothetical protein K443DRAFT_306378 [Laccaria amethystina LaAM-08-1]|uniref:Uncharacterized protein n=1 Tax=Laccaria amethystina LaAM-08-1 TaxID=1095629 RepID=A0A0C9Y7H3_9AGAR|nr:hypothetical protein K443DRAFT_306378 [Laccaria amethystina LaAM-08-1]
MAHSTTATSTYVLAKYSRSHPPKAPTQSQDISSEWQHFTNPLISLILDIKKSSDNELESMRLRILWRINHDGPEDGLNNTEVVFEDIDLLSFSALGSRVPQKQNSQGFPLKAVYRDTLVGIRYMHPRDQIPPTFRRFQVSFLSPSLVSEFINTIQTVCPCKQNPNDSNLNSNPSVIGLPLSVRTQPHAQLSNNVINLQPDRGGPIPLPSAAQGAMQGSQAPFSSPIGIPQHCSSPPFNPSINSVDPPTSSSATSARYGLEATDSLTVSSRDLVQNISLQSASAGYVGQIEPNPSPPTLPTPSSLPCSEQSGTNGGKTIASNTNSRQVPLSDPVLASLKEVTSIYNLSSATLEQVVGDVIREEGFPRLLEQLAPLWKIRSLVGA